MNEEQSCKLFKWDDELKESDFLPRNVLASQRSSDTNPAHPTATQTPPCNGCLYADKLLEAAAKKIDKLQLKLLKERSRVQGMMFLLFIIVILFFLHAIKVHVL